MNSADLPPMTLPPGWSAPQLGDQDQDDSPDTIGHPAVATERRTCGMCPEQWSGQLTDGRYFYFRMRHGMAQLGVGATPDEAVADHLAREVTVPRGYGCFMDAPERLATFTALISRVPCLQPGCRRSAGHAGAHL